jgi:hypothetical protein
MKLKVRSRIGKKDASASQTKTESFIRTAGTPSYFNIVSLDTEDFLNTL